ncbi:hypothetical protein [Buchananella hordeovulneris]|uniref:Uncharacterized protein n=1 Tax=Buchananella hordeovulneris TaxID=52770 RepID=A0A1Q5PYC6_9ACTO|nr:hypothetical protein [Buchananella hordeovulneris]MDO5080305.1 hypothetical protein [Buchananella hordeovulneris]OKL52618.1 hypothetical protein BSZ40_00420 [Buchananella hordeovulneris]
MDAFMVENGFTIWRNSYYTTRYKNGALWTIYVSRPDDEGLGGGYTTGYYEDVDPLGIQRRLTHFNHGFAYRATLTTVREEIDQLFEPWTTLPDPEQIASAEQRYYHFIGAISLHGFGGGITMLKGYDGTLKSIMRSPTVTGEIRSELTQITNNLSTLNGHGISSFKNGFLRQFKPVLLSLLEAALQLGSTIGIEWGLSALTFNHILALLDEAQKTFIAASQGSQRELDMEFELLHDAVTFAGPFPLEALEQLHQPTPLAFSIPKPSSPDADPPLYGSYSAILAALRRNLEELNKQYRDAEQQLAERYTSVARDLATDATRYAVSLHAVTLAPRGEAEVQLDEYRMKEVTDSLQVIRDELFRGSALANETGFGTALVRDARLGLGGNGPSSQFHQALWVLLDRLKALADDTEISRHNLQLWHAALQDADADAVADLEALARELEALVVSPPTGTSSTLPPLPPHLRMD